MAWMLQPKSFYQAMRPNFYTVAYRRSGAYKGMGSLGQDSVSTDVLANLPLVGPYTVGSSQSLPASGAFMPVTSGTTTTTPSAPWMVIAAGLLVLLAMKR